MSDEDEPFTTLLGDWLRAYLKMIRAEKKASIGKWEDACDEMYAASKPLDQFIARLGGAK